MCLGILWNRETLKVNALKKCLKNLRFETSSICMCCATQIAHAKSIAGSLYGIRAK